MRTQKKSKASGKQGNLVAATSESRCFDQLRFPLSSWNGGSGTKNLGNSLQKHNTTQGMTFGVSGTTRNTGEAAKKALKAAANTTPEHPPSEKGVSASARLSGIVTFLP